MTRSSTTAEIVHVIPINHILQKLDTLAYIFITNVLGLTAVNVMQLAPIAAVKCEIMRNDGHSAVQGQ